MAEYLETEHLGFRPSDNEVDRAFDFIGFQVRMFEPEARDETLRMTHDTALVDSSARRNVLVNLLHRKQRLITADQPVLVWRSPTPRHRFEGLGITNAEEVRLPLDPGKQL